MVGEIKVSVVMPTYNGSKFIKRAIESILAQTYTNFEFIIVDDGSTDNTAQIIHSYNDKRIKYIFQENKGPVFTYNRGFKEAQGDYIFIMDHDDYSYPTRLEKQLEYMQVNNLDVCGTNYEIFHERNGYIQMVNRSYSDSELKQKLLYLPAAIFNPTVCIKKSVLKKFDFFDESFKVLYDCEFYLRIMYDVKMGIIPDYLFRYYRLKTSYSSQNQADSRNVFTSIQLKRLEKSKKQLSSFEYYSSFGFLNFYCNRLTRAGLALFYSMFFKIDKTVMKYFLAITFAGPIIKIARKYDLVSLPILRGLKKILLPI